MTKTIYKEEFLVDDLAVDCFGQLKPAMLPYYFQEVAGSHFALLEDPAAPIAEKHLFWAVSRYSFQIHTLPRLGQRITVETWPMPTTRVAYPRAMMIYNEEGQLLVKAISLWVLMDQQSRAMVLPGKSGVIVDGLLRGTEPEVPKNLLPKEHPHTATRQVTYSLLDRNGHMNNTRYLDWVCDLLPSRFHGQHTPAEITLCYLSEALESQEIRLHWELTEDGLLQVDARRASTDVHQKEGRVFTAQVLFQN